MEQGEIIKKLRVERGMSQNTLANGISTRSTLSSFECRKTELSSSILLKYLDKMNVKFDEFQYLVHDYSFNKKEDISHRFIEIQEKEVSSDEVVLFLDQLDNLYKSTKDNFYLMMSCQVRILKSTMLEINIIEKNNAIQTIKDYLFKVENWCHFELSIFNNVLFIFNSTEIIFRFEDVISKMWLLQDANHYNSLISIFLINGCFLGFERNNFDLADLFIRHLEMISLSPRFLEAKLYLLIFKGLYPSLNNKVCELELIEQGIKIFDILDTEKASKLRNFILRYLSNKGFEVYLDSDTNRSGL